MTNSFRQPTLEKSYLTYTHRQRQKSLIIVNVVDLVVKVVLAVINVGWRKSDDVSEPNVAATNFVHFKLISVGNLHSVVCHVDNLRAA